jgi:hypothetical protein
MFSSRNYSVWHRLYLTHRRPISLPLVSLVWSVLIQFITSVSSLSFHQNVDQGNSFNLLCLLSDKFQCFAKGYRKRWLGYWTLANVKLKRQKDCNAERGELRYYISRVLLIHSNVQCFHTRVTFRPSLVFRSYWGPSVMVLEGAIHGSGYWPYD